MRQITAILLATVIGVSAFTPIACAAKPALSIIEFNSGNAWNRGWVQVQELKKVWIAGRLITEIRIIGFRIHPITRVRFPVYGPVDIWIPGHFEWRWVMVAYPT